MTAETGPIPTHLERAKAEHGAKVWTWIARGTGVALVVFVIVIGVFLVFRNGAQATQLNVLSARLADSRSEAEALYKQLLAAGETPVVTPQKGDPGTPGTAGPQGLPGRAPTTAEIYNAVQDYCASVGCIGAAGSAGTNGTNGNDGAPGAAGTNGTNGADGAPGATGPAGPMGATGTSVTAVSCVVDADLATAFRFTFSDGSTSDVPGPCLPNGDGPE